MQRRLAFKTERPCNGIMDKAEMQRPRLKICTSKFGEEADSGMCDIG